MIKFASNFLERLRMGKILLLISVFVLLHDLDAQRLQSIDFENNGKEIFTFDFYEFQIIPNEFLSSENSSEYIVKLSRSRPLTSLGGMVIVLDEPLDVVGDIDLELKYRRDSDLQYFDIKLEEEDNVAFAIQQTIHLGDSKKGWQRIQCHFENLNGYFSKIVIVPGFIYPGQNTVYLDEIIVRY